MNEFNLATGREIRLISIFRDLHALSAKKVNTIFSHGLSENSPKLLRDTNSMIVKYLELVPACNIDVIVLYCN